MKLNSTLLTLITFGGLLGSASAVTALIDFGLNNTPTYNSIIGGGTAALNDTTSSATGWTASVANAGSGSHGTAGGGANVSVFPAIVSSFEATALRDSIFSNQGAGGTDPAMTLTFTGLNPANSYELLLYGSRNNGQGVDQRWSLTAGTGGADVDHFSEDNQLTAVSWTVAPDAGGSIAILLNSPGPDTTGAIALNFGSITEVVPEPSSALLLGLSAAALFVRRKR